MRAYMDFPTTQGGVLSGYSLLLHGGTKWAAQFGLLLRHAGATVADAADVRSHGGLAGSAKRLVVVEVRTKRALSVGVVSVPLSTRLATPQPFD